VNFTTYVPSKRAKDGFLGLAGGDATGLALGAAVGLIVGELLVSSRVPSPDVQAVAAQMTADRTTVRTLNPIPPPV
jgi:hypothetical protein